MITTRALLVDPYSTSISGTQSVYSLDLDSSTLYQIGPALPSGEAPSGADVAANWCSNQVIQVGDYIYAFVACKIFRYDINNPSSGWDTYQTISSPPAAVVHYKTGLYTAVINGQDYIIGACVGDAGGTQIRSFKINLATDTLSTYTYTASVAFANHAFRSCVQFKQKLFFYIGGSGSGYEMYHIYDPVGNINYPITILNSGANNQSPLAGTYHSLVVYNNDLYSIGANRNSGISIWKYDEFALSFTYVNNFSITFNGSTNNLAFVNPSTDNINGLSGATQSIYYLSYSSGWRLYEIYPDTGTTFAAFQWHNGITSSQVIPSGYNLLSGESPSSNSGWGLIPIVDVREYDGDTRYFLLYSSVRSIAGGTSHTIGFIYQVSDTTLDHPQLQVAGASGNWWYYGTPRNLEGSGDKYYSDQDSVATIRISGITRVASGFQLDFKLYSGSASNFYVAFTYSLDGEVPKNGCTLSNASDGSIGSFVTYADTVGYYISGLAADDGTTTYSVIWEADFDGIQDFDNIRIVGLTYPTDLFTDTTFSPAYDFKNVIVETFSDSISSPVNFKHLNVGYSFTDSISSSVGFEAVLVPAAEDNFSVNVEADVNITANRQATNTLTVDASADASIVYGLNTEGLLLLGKTINGSSKHILEVESEFFLTWRSLKLTGSWDNATYDGKFRIIGDVFEAIVEVVLTGQPTDNLPLTLNFPNRVNIDYSKFNAMTSNAIVGNAIITSSSNDSYVCYPTVSANYTDVDNIKLMPLSVDGGDLVLNNYVDNTYPLVFDANDKITIYVKCPVIIQ